MILHIELANFRIFDRAELDFSRRVNLIYGPNGWGKTNLLEALYLCGFGKSFKGANQHFVRIGSDLSRIFAKGEGIGDEVTIVFSGEETKTITIAGKKINRLSQLLGIFPVIYLGPQEINSVAGNPMMKRKFLDQLLCQFDREYLDTLIEYENTVSQRNKVLKGLAQEPPMPGGLVLLGVFDDKIIKLGSYLVRKRVEIVRQLGHLVQDFFTAINGDYSPKVSLKYICTAGDEPESERLEDSFRRNLEIARTQDRKLFQTSIGPHRDNVEIFLDDKSIRLFGSWGQMRMVTLALYMSSAVLLREKTAKTPSILFDDAFAELDMERTKRAIGQASELGQVFIASPREEPVEEKAETAIFLLTEPGKIEMRN